MKIYFFVWAVAATIAMEGFEFCIGHPFANCSSSNLPDETIDLGSFFGGATGNISRRWNFHMPYQIDRNLDGQQVEEIKSAVGVLQKELPCFKFELIPANITVPFGTNYVYFTLMKSLKSSNDGKCSSSIVGKGKNKVEISLVKYIPSCKEPHIVHDIMHVLGFFHEHQRPDREDYVHVHLEKMNKPDQANIRKRYQIEKDQLILSQYDFRSLMHLPLDKYMTLKPGVNLPSGLNPEHVGKPIYLEHLSEGDKIRLRLLYPCKN